MKKVLLVTGFFLVLFGFLFFWLNTSSRYIFESNAHFGSGKIAKAIKTLEEGLEKYPDNHNINFLLAKGYQLTGETHKANELLLSKETISILKGNKELQDLLVELSVANHRLGDEKVARFYGEGYLTYQDTNEASKRVVKNYISVGQVLPEKAVSLWEKSYNIALALKEADLKESIKALLLPRYFQIVENMKLKSEYQKALDILDKASVLGKNPEVIYQKALMYSKLEKFDLAQRHFEEAIELDQVNDSYKISYADILKDEALKTKDIAKKTEYFEKIKLLLSGVEDSSIKTSLLNKIIHLNAKYKITNANLKVTMIGDYFYPSLIFKIKPVSETFLKNYKIIFSDENNSNLDTYESPISSNEVNQLLEVTCRNPISSTNLINAKLFLNDEFVSEYTTK